MGTVILDDDLKAKLNGLNQHLEVRDAGGALVGHFLPDDVYKQMVYDWAMAEFALEEAEEAARGIVRKWDGTNGKTTAEAIASLKQLEERLKAEEQARADPVNFAIIWLDSAEADLLRLYLTARADGNSEAYTRAAARVEHVLATDPANAGESRAGHRRLVTESPLTIEFEVYNESRTAVVTRVRYTPPRSGR